MFERNLVNDFMLFRRAVVGPAVTIGQSTKIGYNVALSNCILGDSCAIHNGVCIGQDAKKGILDEHGNTVKKPQVGDIYP
ncbi:hypothetical protein EZV62_027497 [Acer yangbiense]|uniref:Nucleotidyl transferase domain-containing protein n=1 Tax=Acer yangbiense TaxID=1000413 RepID=A0A5C7GU75_9ROSI|nr:hypothetical protein EZV62_027497 [Acer yangbiense]